IPRHASASTWATTRSTPRRRTRSRACSSASSATRSTRGTSPPRRASRPPRLHSSTEGSRMKRSAPPLLPVGGGGGAGGVGGRSRKLAHVGYAARLEAITGAWLCLVFFGTEWVTRQRAFRVRLHFGFEPGLPLVPALIAAYVSIHVVFALAPFALP